MKAIAICKQVKTVFEALSSLSKQEASELSVQFVHTCALSLCVGTPLLT